MAIDYNKYINSIKTHYIANSGKDEHSGTKGGAAGDQTEPAPEPEPEGVD